MRGLPALVCTDEHRITKPLLTLHSYRPMGDYVVVTDDATVSHIAVGTKHRSQGWALPCCTS